MTVTPARLCARPGGAALPRPAPRLLLAFRLLLYGGLAVAAVWGGPVLRVAALCAIPLALLVDWEGGVRHILRMGGLAAAFWLAPQYGAGLGDFATRQWGWSPTVGAIGGIALVGLLIIALGGMLARLVSRRVRRRRVTGALDHMLGGLVGTAEAGLAVACACWMLAALATPLASVQARVSRVPAAGDVALPAAGVYPAGAPHAGAGLQQPAIGGAQQLQQRILQTLVDISTTVRNDPTGQWLTRSNPLADLTPVRTTGLLLEVAADPAAVLSAVDHGQLDAIGALPELRKYTEAIERDPELRQALERQDFAAVLSHPLVKSMLTDSELHRVLLEHTDDLRRALEVEASAGRP